MNGIISVQFHGFLASGSWNVSGKEPLAQEFTPGRDSPSLNTTPLISRICKIDMYRNFMFVGKHYRAKYSSL